MNYNFLKNISITLCIISIISCAGNNANTVIEGNSKTEGWINENIFRISAEGIPSKTLINPESIKKSAINSAKRHAQNKILFRFKKKSRISGKADISSKLTNKVISIIKKGKIIRVNFDATGRCFIIYEIRQKNLKNDMNNTNFKGIDIIN